MKNVLLITLAIVLAACSAAPTEPTIPPTLPPSDGSAVWENANVDHYRFVLDLSCFCAFRDQMPLTIEVKGGEIVSITRADGQVVQSDDPSYETFVQYGTIDNILSKIESAQADPEAGEVLVTYDETYGYPADATIDYIELATDDEMYLTISSFEVLP
jgi:hypothetical protein